MLLREEPSWFKKSLQYPSVYAGAVTLLGVGIPHISSQMVANCLTHCLWNNDDDDFMSREINALTLTGALTAGFLAVYALWHVTVQPCLESRQVNNETLSHGLLSKNETRSDADFKQTNGLPPPLPKKKSEKKASEKFAWKEEDRTKYIASLKTLTEETLPQQEAALAKLKTEIPAVSPAQDSEEKRAAAMSAIESAEAEIRLHKIRKYALGFLVNTPNNVSVSPRIQQAGELYLLTERFPSDLMRLQRAFNKANAMHDTNPNKGELNKSIKRKFARIEEMKAAIERLQVALHTPTQAPTESQTPTQLVPPPVPVEFVSNTPASPSPASPASPADRSVILPVDEKSKKPQTAQQTTYVTSTSPVHGRCGRSVSRLKAQVFNKNNAKHLLLGIVLLQAAILATSYVQDELSLDLETPTGRATQDAIGAVITAVAEVVFLVIAPKLLSACQVRFGFSRNDRVEERGSRVGLDHESAINSGSLALGSKAKSGIAREPLEYLSDQGSEYSRLAATPDR